ncbi:adenosylcobinamide-phosphate synthase CbiB [Desertibaculum subflavum]|uniref:adenosylcobinamide-phosphate synthase CbiB n=1 Tax=Desertibaculum subflavum TaxID=2268458 RepID=UPI000E673115
MPFDSTLALACAALLIEALVGYPAALYRVVRHPVVWIGAAIGALDRHFNLERLSPGERRLGGIVAMVIVLILAALPAWVFTAAVCSLIAPALALIFLAVLAAPLLAQRSLYAHVAAVADGLEREGLAGGRAAVSRIVGRDPDSLDEAAVARAAIESLAENFSDGVTAPAFWCAVLGLPGIAAYKAVNTADSMIGHRTARHLAFGWAAARFDDLVNLPASRLSALLLVAAAALRRDSDAAGAWRAVRRDARQHRSPNAGWPEAAMAGALGRRLAGPRVYGGTLVEDAWMGDGSPDASAADIRRALALYRVACGLLIALLGALAALVTWLS